MAPPRRPAARPPGRNSHPSTPAHSPPAPPHQHIPHQPLCPSCPLDVHLLLGWTLPLTLCPRPAPSGVLHGLPLHPSWPLPGPRRRGAAEPHACLCTSSHGPCLCTPSHGPCPGQGHHGPCPGQGHHGPCLGQGHPVLYTSQGHATGSLALALALATPCACHMPPPARDVAGWQVFGACNVGLCMTCGAGWQVFGAGYSVQASGLKGLWEVPAWAWGGHEGAMGGDCEKCSSA